MYEIDAEGIVHYDDKASNILVVLYAKNPLQLVDFSCTNETRSLFWFSGIHKWDPLYAALEARVSFTAPLPFDVFSAAMVEISVQMP